MRRIAVLVTACALGFSGLTLAATPAHACAELECRIACIKSTLALEPYCPR